MHPGYKFETASSKDMSKCLVTYLKMVRFDGKEIKLLIRRMLVKSISGSVKICKTFLNLNYF